MLKKIFLRLFILIIIVGIRLIPVSYTHLDVYKRQGPTLDVAVDDPGTDVFGVDSSDPSKGAFAVLDRLATTLETSPATLHQDLGTALQDLDQGLDSLNATRTKVGVRLKAMEDQEYALSLIHI